MSLLLRTFLPYILGILLAAISLGGVYWYVRHQGAQAEREAAFKREVAEYKLRVEKANVVALELERLLAGERQRVDELKKDLKNETGSKIIYRSCVTPDSGMCLYNEARTGTCAR